MSEEILERQFSGEVVESGDGRTLEVRIVPYNRTARVSDPPNYEPYDEMFVEGVFDAQLSAPNRLEMEPMKVEESPGVWVNVEHEPGIGGVVGRGVSLRSVPGDGFHGTFRMLDHPDADKALELVKAGDLTGVSVEFTPKKSVRENGVVKRVKARLVNIALVRPNGSAGGIQAYKDAGVLAVRQAQEFGEHYVENNAEPRPVIERSSDVDELLQRVGFAPLERRTVVRSAWNTSDDVFDDETWQRSCLLDRGEHIGDIKTRFAFPVVDENGDLNLSRMQDAARRLAHASASPQQKARAARQLVRYYRQAKETPPATLVALAGRA